jgi:hypothetical protein
MCKLMLRMSGKGGLGGCLIIGFDLGYQVASGVHGGLDVGAFGGYGQANDDPGLLPLPDRGADIMELPGARAAPR